MSTNDTRLVAAETTLQAAPAAVAPKRNQNSYMLFAGATRAAMKEQHPDASISRIAELLGEAWRAMDAEARAPYEQMAATDKQRFQDAMVVYKAAHPNAVVVRQPKAVGVRYQRREAAKAERKRAREAAAEEERQRKIRIRQMLAAPAAKESILDGYRAILQRLPQRPPSTRSLALPHPRQRREEEGEESEGGEEEAEEAEESEEGEEGEDGEGEAGEEGAAEVSWSDLGIVSSQTSRPASDDGAPSDAADELGGIVAARQAGRTTPLAPAAGAEATTAVVALTPEPKQSIENEQMAANADERDHDDYAEGCDSD